MKPQNQQSSREIMCGRDAGWWHKGDSTYNYLCTFSFNFSCDYEERTAGFGYDSFKYKEQVNKKVELVLRSNDWKDQRLVLEAWEKYFAEHGKNYIAMQFVRDCDFEDLAHLFFKFLRQWRFHDHVDEDRHVPRYTAQELEGQRRGREYEEQRREQMNREWNAPSPNSYPDDFFPSGPRNRFRY